MSRFGFDEQGRALEAEARDATPDADPLALAARAQSAEIERARAAITDTEVTPETLPELLRHAAGLPDVHTLTEGVRSVWDRWVPVLESTHLGLEARRDLAAIAHRLPEAQKVGVLERVFHVPLGADARAVDDLLDDAAEMPAADADSAQTETDTTLHLSGPEALLAGLFDGPEAEQDVEKGFDADAALAGLTADATALWTGGVERRMDVAGFVRACAPQVTDRSRAEAVMGAYFGGDGPGDEPDPRWWRDVARLRRRFPILVAALEGADGQHIAVRGGYARVDLTARTLGVYMPAKADANR